MLQVIWPTVFWVFYLDFLFQSIRAGVTVACYSVWVCSGATVSNPGFFDCVVCDLSTDPALVILTLKRKSEILIQMERTSVCVLAQQNQLHIHMCAREKICWGGEANSKKEALGMFMRDFFFQ